LAEQFQRLDERNVSVYWAGGGVDPPEAWPPSVRLPENVHVFPRGRPEAFVHQRDQTRLARVVGASRGRTIRTADFDPDPSGLFTIAAVHGNAQVAALQSRPINYWALGGRHIRSTLFSTAHLAHYPGSPQGRQPEECGAHGCTLVQVDSQANPRTTLVPTDVMRWQNERVVVDEATSRDDLEQLLRERMHTLVEATGETDLLISWTVAGGGPLVAQLRQPAVTAQLLDWLRSEYGFGPPAAWTVSLSVEPTAVLPPEWYEQETIRGDFLRAVQQYQANTGEPLDLEAYLSEEQVAGTLGTAAAISDKAARRQVLRQAAVLGVDLLSGEEPQS